MPLSPFQTDDSNPYPDQLAQIIAQNQAQNQQAPQPQAQQMPAQVDPNAPVMAPSYAVESALIARRRALAQALQTQGMETPTNTQTVSGYAIRNSPLIGIGNLAKVLAGNYIDKKAVGDEASLNLNSNQAMINALRGADPSDPSAMYAAAANPALRPEQAQALLTQGSTIATKAAEGKQSLQNSLILKQQEGTMNLANQKELKAFEIANPSPTTDMQNFTNAQQGGYKGNFMQYMKDKRETPMMSFQLGQLQDPTAIEPAAKAIAEGRAPYPTAMALRTPMGMALISKALELNPNLDATTYQTRQKAEKDFATGAQGNSVRSLNVAVQHINLLQNAAKALDSGNIPLMNSIANQIGIQTGADPATTYNAIHGFVTDEISKAAIGGKTALGDRMKSGELLPANMSPAQRASQFQAVKGLLNGQLSGLRLQATQSGVTNFDKYLSPDVLSEVGGAPAAAPAPTTNAKGWVLHTDAKGNKAYVSPDNKQFEAVQ